MDANAISVAVFEKLAQQYADLYMDVSAYAEALLFFCGKIYTDAPVLELACGPGNVTQFLLKARPDLKILATDLSPAMLAIAQKNNPTATFQQYDCREIDALDQVFDGIVAAFCLPYLDPLETSKLFQNTFNKLIENGFLFISTIEGQYSNSGWQTGSSGEKVYMHLHSADVLVPILTTIGFKIIYQGRVQTKDARGQSNTDLLLIAQKTQS